MIEAVYREDGRVEMVDLGGVENYWNIVSPDFLDNHKVEITIVNIPGADLPEAHGRFRFVEADCCDLAGKFRGQHTCLFEVPRFR
ncbi:MAG: hypothetical protein GY785_24600 [Gammaproteobacteria bacterium]|nr:hypothetical protein [Gammaproteobacteria bacterium]